jgi:uncharacterized protein
MRREDLTLIMLALADGGHYTPVQIQKAMFLAEDMVSEAFDLRYDFQPYDYGPFDQNVYHEIEGLELNDLARISTAARGWNTYAATAAGVLRGRELLQCLTPEQQELIKKISRFVRRLSFTALVSAIYKAYPHMRERSVFRH